MGTGNRFIVTRSVPLTVSTKGNISVRFNFSISEYKAAYGKELAGYVAPGYKRRRSLDRWLLAMSRERMHSFCVCHAMFSVPYLVIL